MSKKVDKLSKVKIPKRIFVPFKPNLFPLAVVPADDFKEKYGDSQEAITVVIPTKYQSIPSAGMIDSSFQTILESALNEEKDDMKKLVIRIKLAELFPSNLHTKDVYEQLEELSKKNIEEEFQNPSSFTRYFNEIQKKIEVIRKKEQEEQKRLDDFQSFLENNHQPLLFTNLGNDF